MIIEKLFAYNFRMYPNEEQVVFLSKHFGCCRFIYNELLSYRNRQYTEHGKSIGGFEAKRRIAILKRDPQYAWLKQVNSQSLQEQSINLEKGFQRFFQNKGGYPKYKKKQSRQSFTIPQHFQIKKTRSGKSFLYVPKCRSGLSIVAHQEIFGDIKRLTIKKTQAGNYYVSLTCIKKEEIKEAKDTVIGIDVGINRFLVTSDGRIEKPIKILYTHERRLKKVYRRLSNKKKGSKNREKARLKVARYHERIANIRKDFLHKLSRNLVNENQVIRIENLNIKGLLKNHCLAKAISDASWGRFFEMLIYKARWAGKQVEKIERFAPSSKLCSCCSSRNNELKLKNRKWTCLICGANHDRDINAAINIKKLGQGMSEIRPVERTINTFHTNEKQIGSRKQEPYPNAFVGMHGDSSP